MHNFMNITGSNNQILRYAMLFLAAYLLRLAYLAVVVVNDGQLLTSDSGIYLSLANNILDYGGMSADATKPHIIRMPLYPYFLAAGMEIFGRGALTAIVATQMAIDSLTVIGIAVMAGAINRRWMWPSGIAAALWPNLVIQSSQVMTDSLFLFFLVWGMAVCLWAAHGRNLKMMLSLAGRLFGLALMTRPLLMFFRLVLVPALAVLLVRNLQLGWKKSIILAIIPPLIMLAVSAPRLITSKTYYSGMTLSAQSGEHALNYIYPCIKTPWSCGDFVAIAVEHKKETLKALEGYSAEQVEDPVIIDKVRKELALEKLLNLPVSTIAHSLAAGTTLNLFHSSVSQIGYQLGIKKKSILHTFSSSGPEVNIIQRAYAAVTQDNFTVFWIAGIAALFVSRIVQLAGVLGALGRKETIWPAVFLITISLYFLAINGPVGNARYRLPMEPLMIIMFVSGITYLSKKKIGNLFVKRK